MHAIQDRYGWSDEYVLDLRISRLVQIVHVIQSMFEIETHVRRAEIEWQTRVLATYIAHTVPDGKAAGTLLDAVNKLSLNNEDGEEASADTPSNKENRTLEDIMEHGNVEEALRRNSLRQGPGLSQLRWSKA